MTELSRLVRKLLESKPDIVGTEIKASEIVSMGVSEQGVSCCKISECNTVEFIYDSKEERDAHAMEMRKLGYTGTGQTMENINIGDFVNPVYTYYAKYIRRRDLVSERINGF